MKLDSLQMHRTSYGMNLLRTPDECFNNIDFPFEANYVYLNEIRVHYLDENKSSEKIIVLLHGLPAWGYLYRKIIPTLSKAGYRVIVPDLIGFGKSDKPTNRKDYSYSKNETWLQEFLFDKLNLENINIVAHDWGGLIALRLVARFPKKFQSVVAMNTAFPRIEGFNFVFYLWRIMSNLATTIPYSKLFKLVLKKEINLDILKGYDAPFPSRKHKTAPKVFPKLVPMNPFSIEAKKNKKLWKLLCDYENPLLTIFSENDPFTKDVEKDFIENIKGADNIKHHKVKSAGHFLQEEHPELISSYIIDFLRDKVYN